jgi:hypothetical protein
LGKLRESTGARRSSKASNREDADVNASIDFVDPYKVGIEPILKIRR